MKKKSILLLSKIAVYPLWKKAVILLAVSILFSFFSFVATGKLFEPNTFFGCVFIAFVVEMIACIAINISIKFCLYNYFDKKERKKWKDFYENRHKAH